MYTTLRKIYAWIGFITLLLLVGAIVWGAVDVESFINFLTK